MPRFYKTKKYDITIGSNDSEALTGSAASDVMFGGGGNDYLLGGFGNDYLFGGAGNDVLFGGDGNDNLWGGSGADILNGGAGNDRIRMNDGDTGIGGAGADTFKFDAASAGNITISDFDASEGDVLAIRGDTSFTAEQGLNHTVITFEAGAVLELYGVTLEEVMADPDLFGLG